MKFQIMLDMLFYLLTRRRVSASELAGRYEVSVRTVYRYVDEMTVAGIPIDVARGVNGGVYIADSFKLPKGFFTKEEYKKTLASMLAMNEQMHDDTLSAAIRKLEANFKTERYDVALSGNILVDGGTWGDERKFSQKLTLVERAIEETKTLVIDYVSREGEHSRREILPHLLVYKQNVWYVYAFCTVRGAFRLFKLGRIRAISETEKTFTRIPFRREDVPLNFWQEGEKSLEVAFEIKKEALPFAEEWLGIENIAEHKGKYIAEVSLPDDDALLQKILSLGSGVKVVSPASLCERVKKAAASIAAEYEES